MLSSKIKASQGERENRKSTNENIKNDTRIHPRIYENPCKINVLKNNAKYMHQSHGRKTNTVHDVIGFIIIP